MHTCNFNNTAKVAAALDYFVPWKYFINVGYCNEMNTSIIYA
jgi:hypothetical protein